MGWACGQEVCPSTALNILSPTEMIGVLLYKVTFELGPHSPHLLISLRTPLSCSLS